MSQTVDVIYDGHNFKFTCHDLGKDIYVGDAILKHGIYDDVKTSIWYNHIQPGDLVIDVGANIGWFSKIARIKGADVIAIEPDPKAYSLLIDNCPDIEAYQMCAGNSTDGVKLWLNDDNYGDNRTGSAGIDCIQNTLDNIVGDRPIAAIKIDTQGWEPNIIAGAANTIKNMKSGAMVIMEYWPYGLKLNEFDVKFLETYLGLFSSSTYHHNDGSIRDLPLADFDTMADNMHNFGDIVSIK